MCCACCRWVDGSIHPLISSIVDSIWMIIWSTPLLLIVVKASHVGCAGPAWDAAAWPLLCEVNMKPIFLTFFLVFWCKVSLNKWGGEVIQHFFLLLCLLFLSISSTNIHLHLYPGFVDRATPSLFSSSSPKSINSCSFFLFILRCFQVCSFLVFVH